MQYKLTPRDIHQNSLLTKDADLIAMGAWISISTIKIENLLKILDNSDVRYDIIARYNKRGGVLVPGVIITATKEDLTLLLLHEELKNYDLEDFEYE